MASPPPPPPPSSDDPVAIVTGATPSPAQLHPHPNPLLPSSPPHPNPLPSSPPPLLPPYPTNPQLTHPTPNHQSGIGLALARTLLTPRHGHTTHRVALVGRRTDVGTALARSLDPSGGTRARFFAADVASYASQAAMFRAVREAFGRVDVLVANAGETDRGSVYGLLDGEEDAQEGEDGGEVVVPPEPDLGATDVCYKGVVYGVLLAARFMRGNDAGEGGVRGRVVVTGSVGAFHPHPVVPEYCGAKAAVVAFVRGVAGVMWAKHRVVVNVVHPGLVSTPIVPEEMIRAVPEGCPTPMETVLEGFRIYLEDETGRTGEQMEASGTNIVYYDRPAYANGIATEGATTVWEPWFVMGHGEESGLSGTYR
ncbi:15-hydroxyprostaglandin dehydrogenase [Diplodia corticola]|uniref:15-hydroxyprostaglandin dehydrogenase n=1 Tax=Diplodia corticola TaxID=236234 RepID=A0A1J9R4J1_9PEZI|nr:15-hydroxyprostaglandin dehydrogenase [Diplodia corticola]OJD35497.1 15-hydroxyprostaglandin dehydrogenase [Diplodia corticola]